jgi:hypothetical protein
MPSFIADHPMLCALALIFIDIAVWRLISVNLANWKLAARLAIFAEARSRTQRNHIDRAWRDGRGQGEGSHGNDQAHCSSFLFEPVMVRPR